MERLTDLSPANLASAIKANPRSWSEVLDAAPGIETVRLGGVVGHVSRVKFGLFNAVFFPEFEQGVDVDAVVDGFLDLARDRDVPMIWWLDPNAGPIGLESQLVRRGFRLSGEVPGVAADLASLEEEPLPAGVEIKTATEGLLPVWGRVCQQSFGFPACEAGPLADWMRPSLTPGSPARIYLAFLHGEPVATSAVLDAAGVAGLYLIGTLSTARRRGIGRAITLRPLLEARARGFRAGTLQASASGLSVYQRLGFEQYTVTREYVWEPDFPSAARPGAAPSGP